MAELQNVKGFAELDKFLQELPAKMERNVLRGAMRAGANVVKPVAQSNIHNVSGDLARSLTVNSRARGGQVTATVGTKVFYARFVEYGTRPHRIAARDGGALGFGGAFYKSVDHPGIVNPHPFLRPALDTQAAAAVIAAGEYIKKRLSDKYGLDTADIEIGAEA